MNTNLNIEEETYFGKDFGVIHEMMVTGRKCGAQKEFYSFLAHNEKEFTAFTDLISHWNIIKKHKINIRPVDMGKLKALIWEMKYVFGSCVPCAMEKPLIYRASKVSIEKFFLEKKIIHGTSEESKKDSTVKFSKWLSRQFFKIGIHPEELVVSGLFSKDKNGNLSGQRGHGDVYINCYSSEILPERLQQIITRRQIIFQMMNL